MAKKIGEILLSRNQITGEQLQEGLSTQVVYGARLGTALVQLGHISLDDVGRGLSTQHGVPHAESDMLDNTEQTALDAVSRELCEKLKVVPMRLEGEILHVAMMDPLRSVAGEISFELGFPIQRYVAPELRVLYYLEQFYDIQRDPRYLRLPEAGEEAEAAPAEPPPAAGVQAGPTPPGAGCFGQGSAEVHLRHPGPANPGGAAPCRAQDGLSGPGGPG